MRIQQSTSMHVHGECLLQFPDLVLLHYMLWLPGGTPDDLGKDEFFDVLIGSEAYQQQRLAHANEEEHGPFAVSEIRPEHYNPVTYDVLADALESRLIPTPSSQFDDPWPSASEMKGRLEALLSSVRSNALRCYELTLSLGDEQCWSKSHREIRILEHFEEWIVVDTESDVVHMIQLIRD